MSAKRARKVRRKKAQTVRRSKRRQAITTVPTNPDTYSVRPAIFQMDIYDFSDYPSDDYTRKYAD